ncbi:GNAT family N-acetyltransferase [Streptomonospora salina]|uniref:Ribosomal-protein-alanine N-acetyltransferase n=1 Tax=Streptomonospora salina TaxID=104205 RepID=A0A841E7U8_9ACTN|nr:GNAT family protein [Streptomonospora salina]MBB5997198.1 ribosomal-protein-alanine N-acetyltransferase [Streptomonospora salina]
MPTTRLVTPEDAPELAELLRGNREFLAPWEPERDDSYFTAATQRTLLERARAEHAAGRMLPLAVLDGTDRIAGRITVNGIVRGAFLSATVGYWVSRSHNGRGLATEAVAETVRTAFADLGLHRIEAATLPHNTASQRVLLRNGFTAYGRAPQYLRIAGHWQEHILYQVLNTRM